MHGRCMACKISRAVQGRSTDWKWTFESDTRFFLLNITAILVKVLAKDITTQTIDPRVNFGFLDFPSLYVISAK